MTAQARCDARLLELVGEFDAGTGWAWYDGITSCVHWLMWACSMGPGTAREHLRVARALRSMPIIAARFADGDLTYSKVRELTRVAGQVDEDALCDLALAQTASQLARTVREYRAHAGTHLGQESRRRLSWRETDDGMVRLSVTLLPEEAAVLHGALDAATDLQLDAPGSGSDPEPSRPALDQVAGLCEVARGYLTTVPASSVDDPHLVVVHVDAECLAATFDQPVAREPAVPGAAGSGIVGVPSATGDGDATCDVPAGTSPRPRVEVGPSHDVLDGPAHDIRGYNHNRRHNDNRGHSDPVQHGRAWIERGGPIEAATAARHACDAPLIGMIIDRHGDILAMGRARRLASPAQRRALRVRDGGCRFPGCSQHRRLKAHHIVSWADGGPTDLDNLILLCQAHHTYVHEGGVRITGGPGAWVFILPGGTVINPAGPDTAMASDQIDAIVRGATEAAARQPDRVFPPGAGEGFEIVACVRRLFDIRLPTDTPPALDPAA
ncbi:HNH endonuclease signature motif containing protein [Raineyella sp. W15-4]|uniref:HNH endonuclease signature motif containing protein n=1 Tax=Raineyella sp. W15-4 TaxID=3081651 RepID=UPI00295545E2|nr:DUF222 domain-containing protein [Raineyella sp. W15-4]WOQ17961.1 DUF222 domain-containing protein [Raineyella sp. W15-4]